MIDKSNPFFATQHVYERKLSVPSAYTFAKHESKSDTNSTKNEELVGVNLPLNMMSVAVDV